MRMRTCVPVVVCVACKLRPCPSYNGRRDHNNSIHWHSLCKGGGGVVVYGLIVVLVWIAIPILIATRDGSQQIFLIPVPIHSKEFDANLADNEQCVDIIGAKTARGVWGMLIWHMLWDMGIWHML